MISYKKMTSFLRYQREIDLHLNVLRNVGKKDPPEQRVELLQTLKDVLRNNFREIEPWIIPRLLPVLLGRLDDKPQVMEEVLDLGKISEPSLSISVVLLSLSTRTNLSRSYSAASFTRNLWLRSRTT